MAHKSGMLMNGDRCDYYYKGLVHRENDMPAIIISDYYKTWVLFGIIVRNYGLSSMIDSNLGNYAWTDSSGKRVRNVYGLYGCLIIGDKQEVSSFTGFIKEGGIVRKYENGLYHRENDMPARVTGNGSMVWYEKGRMGRKYGLPCLITDDGTRMWFKEDSNKDMSRTRSISLDELNGALVIGFKDDIFGFKDDILADDII